MNTLLEKETGNDTRLPDKLSELIRVALADLEKCEALSQYEIQMGEWHTYDSDRDVCLVCFAGAVMAQTLGRRYTFSCGPCLFDHDRGKLLALDALRSGNVSRALYELGLPIADHFDRSPTHHAEDPEWFKADMRALADDLERAGL